MSDCIFLRRSEGPLEEMYETAYAKEDDLQLLLAKHPDLLPGALINAENPRRWLLIDREVPLPGEEDGAGRFSLDHLFLDQDAVPTLVEVKRSCDTRSRREVVAQMLDYAANATAYYTVERMQALFETRCREEAADPLACLAAYLDGDRDPDDYWQTAKTNLQAGRLRMIFVADVISPELRRIVEFLNHQMDPAEVLAVEVRQYVGEGIQTLVPRLFGQTAKNPPSGPKVLWDEQSVLKELEERGGAASSHVGRRLLEWIRRACGEPRWGTGGTAGSVLAEFTHNKFRHVLFELWTYGRIGIRFQRLARVPPFDSIDRRTEIVSRLNAISGVDLKSVDGIPSFPITALSDDAAMSQFCDVMEWIVREIKAA